jgi:hypothetical protein
MMVPPTFLAPTIVYTNFQQLAGSSAVLTPQNLIGGSQDDKPQRTYNYSLGIQRELPYHMIMDVSYVGNALKNGYGEMYDSNAVAPLTTWKPSGCVNPVQGGCPQTQFIDPQLHQQLQLASGAVEPPLRQVAVECELHFLPDHRLQHVEPDRVAAVRQSEPHEERGQPSARHQLQLRL